MPDTAFDQTLANIVTELYDVTDPEWTSQLLEYVDEHLDDPSLPTTLAAALEYNRTFADDSAVLQ